MLIDKSSLIPQGGIGTGGISPAANPSVGDVGKNSGNSGKTNSATGADSVFGNVLDSKLGIPQNGGIKADGPAATSKIEGLKFSQHALERMSSRGISFKPDELTKLNEAISKAEKKGSKESLVLMGDNALIVSVKNRTVVTAMDREAMRDNVFTNIDSTVIL